jgi:hypothetical protein
MRLFSSKKNTIRKTLVFSIIVIIISFTAYKNAEHPIIRSDGEGYYSYLPSFIIFHDKNFQKTNTLSDVYNQKIVNAGFCREQDGKRINQFTCGLALIWSPVFLIVYGIESALGHSVDGYGSAFQFGVTLMSVLFLFFGIIALYGWLRSYKLGEWPVRFAIIAIVGATNLFYYAFYEPSMSHVYSFALISMFLFFGRQYFINGKSSKLIYAAVTLGLIILIRPANSFILILLPLLAGGNKLLLIKLKETFRYKRKALVIATLCLFLIWGIQAEIWHLQTGKWIIDSYKNQGFHWLEPHMWLILFGFRKGLLIYTPLILFSMAGIFILLRKRVGGVWALLVFLSVFIYLVSCWWSWWYGMSFGHRAFVDILAVFALPLAFLFAGIHKRSTGFILAIIVVILMVINHIQTYQYRYYILHWDQMTLKKYCKVFLKTGDEWRGQLWTLQKNDLTWKSEDHTYYFYKNDLEEIYQNWNTNSCLITEVCSGSVGSLAVLCDGYFTNTCIFEKKLNEIQDSGAYDLQLSFGGQERNINNPIDDDIALVVTIDSMGQTVYYHESEVIFTQSENKWRNANGRISLSMNHPESKTLKAYFMTKDKKRRYFDDFSVLIVRSALKDSI